ncbi:MAG: glycosyltransferase, partial [Bacteroidetes bacterium]
MTLLTVLYFILSLGFVFFLTLPFFNVLLSRGVREQLFVPKNKKDYDFGIVITAYKNVEIAKGLVHSLLNQTAGIFRIYLIADHCDVSKWDIRHELLDVLRPAEPLNLKAKSIIYGMENFRRPHDYTIVFDADNLAHPDFLKVINSYANAGLRAIQGQRTAKNLDTVYACADATGEFYKNYIERYVPWLLGSSAVISGSGMAVETDLYAAYLRSPEIEQGKHLWKKMLQEDKILQNFLLRRDERIAYARDAIVFDEKVSTGRDVETQRSRWLYSYFQNMKNAVGILRRGVVNRSWNQFLFGLITLA